MKPNLTPLMRLALAECGRIGGKLSKRKITPEQQAKMQKARKAKKTNQ